MFTSWDKKWNRQRKVRRGGSPRCRLCLEELESRVVLNGAAGASVIINRPITTDPAVQQMPSVAVDPLDAHHLVVAYMDRALVSTGYAGIEAAVSFDGGNTWQRTAVPLPAGFDQGAANPSVRFDGQGARLRQFHGCDLPGAAER